MHQQYIKINGKLLLNSTKQTPFRENLTRYENIHIAAYEHGCCNPLPWYYFVELMMIYVLCLPAAWNNDWERPTAVGHDMTAWHHWHDSSLTFNSIRFCNGLRCLWFFGFLKERRQTWEHFRSTRPLSCTALEDYQSLCSLHLRAWCSHMSSDYIAHHCHAAKELLHSGKMC